MLKFLTLGCFAFSISLASWTANINLAELKFFNEEMSLADVAEAISEWGEIHLIMRQSGGLNHALLVKFNKPVKWNYDDRSAITVYLNGGHGISNTPFHLRGIYDMTGSCLHNVIFSDEYMLIDINMRNLWDEANNIYKLIVTDYTADYLRSYFTKRENSNAMELDKNISRVAKRLLMKFWLQHIGHMIQTKGFYKWGRDFCQMLSIETIVANYTVTTKNSFCPWKVVYKK